MNNKHSIKVLNEVYEINRELQIKLNKLNKFLTKTKNYENDRGLSDHIREKCFYKLLDILDSINETHKWMEEQV